MRSVDKLEDDDAINIHASFFADMFSRRSTPSITPENAQDTIF
jgi:hypothetical protein